MFLYSSILIILIGIVVYIIYLFQNISDLKTKLKEKDAAVNKIQIEMQAAETKHIKDNEDVKGQQIKDNEDLKIYFEYLVDTQEVISWGNTLKDALNSSGNIADTIWDTQHREKIVSLFLNYQKKYPTEKLKSIHTKLGANEKLIKNQEELIKSYLNLATAFRDRRAKTEMDKLYDQHVFLYYEVALSLESIESVLKNRIQKNLKINQSDLIDNIMRNSN